MSEPELQLDTRPVSQIPPLPGESVDVLFAGVWMSATVELSPNDHPDPRQRMRAWKVRVHMADDFPFYIWNEEKIRSNRV